MPFALHPLPVVQNWDCHVCGSCCKEYHVRVTDEERRRIQAQGWEHEPGFEKLPLFQRYGLPGGRSYELTHHADGTCIFLSDQGRCRIHEKFGAEAKPLACRLYPFVLVPADDHWRVGLRFACPSVTENKGRQAAAHYADLRRMAGLLAARAGLPVNPATAGGPGLPAPRLRFGQHIPWPDLLRFVDLLHGIVRDGRRPVEHCLRKCLAVARLCRQARFGKVRGKRLDEFLQVVSASVDAELPAEASAVPPPGWVGRVLFRQALATLGRKDQGPNRGISAQGRLALMQAALRFARGQGAVPKVHARLPDVTFEQVEEPAGPLPPEAEELLRRYYAIKIDSMQFCGPTYFGVGLWEGFEALALTYPAILWLRRAYRALPPFEAVARSLIIVDDHFGFNRVLGTRRQRLSFRILAATGELDRLIAWYSR